jgi:hypothetical protein
VYPNLPGPKVAKAIYSHNNGRPSKDVNVYMSLLIVQKYFNLTDQETVDRLAYDSFLQYALYIENGNDKEAYVSRRAFWDFKEKVKKHDLYNSIFEYVTLGLTKLNNVNTSHVRLDSVHFMTNSSLISRNDVFYKASSRFIKNLKKKKHRGFF